MLIKAKNKFGPGIQYDLKGQDDLFIGKGVTIVSFDDDTITAETGRHRIVVEGTVISSGDDAIDLDSEDQATVIIRATGSLVSEDDAVYLDGAGSTLVNRGTIAAGFWGVRADTETGLTTRVTNSGTIDAARDGINVSGDEGTFVLRNSGTISGDDLGFEGSDARDVIFNTGIIKGGIEFAEGNDFYDGRGGRVVGSILGGFGNDTFLPGSGVEVIDGGEGTDLLDFRLSSAVRVALDGSFANGGIAARGDTYAGIENVFGSVKGADALTGNDANNLLKGLGANDRLSGGTGNDTLNGGAGRDVLTGGADFASDTFVFERLSHAGDRITDFISFLDTIRISDTGFGINLAEGTLNADRFISGTTRQAQDAEDRFIFRTGDESLWFDRDGTGQKFKPVLLADLQDGAFMTSANIVII